MNDPCVAPGPLLSLAYARWTVYGPAREAYGLRAYRAATPDEAIHLHACVGRFGIVGYRLRGTAPDGPWQLTAINPDEDAITAAAFAAAGIGDTEPRGYRLSEVLARSGWQREAGPDARTELVFTDPGGRLRVSLVTAHEPGRLPVRVWQITACAHDETPVTAEVTTPAGVLVAFLIAAAELYRH